MKCDHLIRKLFLLFLCYGAYEEGEMQGAGYLCYASTSSKLLMSDTISFSYLFQCLKLTEDMILKGQRQYDPL